MIFFIFFFAFAIYIYIYIVFFNVEVCIIDYDETEDLIFIIINKHK